MGLSAFGSPPSIGILAEGWRRLFRASTEVPSSTTAVGAGADAQVTSTGIKIVIQPGQALYVKRYVVGISQASQAIYIISPGSITISLKPFGLTAPSPVGYGQAYVPTQPSANVPTSGTISGGPGDVLTLVEDWYEWDDYKEVVQPGVVGGLLFQGTWVVRNASGAGVSVGTGPEFLLYEIWQRPKDYRV